MSRYRWIIGSVTAVSLAMTGSYYVVAQEDRAEVAPAVELAAATGPQSSVVLQPGSTGAEAIVSWQTVGTAPEQLKVTGSFGTKLVQASVPPTAQLLTQARTATITGLEPGETYRYQVGSEETGWSAEYEYTTDDGDGNWNFLVFGDPQIGVNTLIDAQKNTWMNTVDAATADVPDAQLLVSVGDQVEGWGSAVDQHRALLETPQVRNIPLSTIPGNHETYSGAMEFYKAFFSHPNQEEDIQDYYFEKNNVLFIGLDTNDLRFDKHTEFVKKTVADHGSNNDWIVVMLHHGPFSQGSHVTDSDVKQVRENLAPVFTELGVDAVLSGHDHIYTRSHLMNGTEPVGTGLGTRGDRLEPKDGEVLYITSTSTGAGKYYDFQDRFGESVPNARMEYSDDFNHPAYPWTAYWRQDYDPDYLKVQVTPEQLTFTTYDADQPYVIDKVTLVNNDAPAHPTTAKPSTSTSSTSTSTTTITSTATTTLKPTASPTATDEPSAAGSSDNAAIASIVVSVLGILGALGALVFQQFGPQINQLLGR